MSGHWPPMFTCLRVCAAWCFRALWVCYSCTRFVWDAVWLLSVTFRGLLCLTLAVCYCYGWSLMACVPTLTSPLPINCSHSYNVIKKHEKWINYQLIFIVQFIASLICYIFINYISFLSFIYVSNINPYKLKNIIDGAEGILFTDGATTLF